MVEGTVGSRGISRRKFLGLSAAAGAGAVLLGGCGAAGAGSSKTLTLGYIGWDENVANSHVVKALAEDDLGYRNVELQLADVGPVFQGVARGNTDAFLDAWMPGHQEYLDKVGDGAKLMPEVWYLGETEYGIAVPDYMKDVKSITDLDDSGAKEITGIEAGALLMKRIRNRVIPQYGLNLELVSSSTPAMLIALQRAYDKKEPFVFLGWSPHWMNARYDFHYLEDPKDAMGSLVDPSKLYAVVHEDLKEKDPVAYALIDAMKFDKGQMSELEDAINKNDKSEPMKGTRVWLKKNRKLVDPWVQAAKKARKA